jgi:hypothetical protein
LVEFVCSQQRARAKGAIVSEEAAMSVRDVRPYGTAGVARVGLKAGARGLFDANVERMHLFEPETGRAPGAPVAAAVHG